MEFNPIGLLMRSYSMAQRALERSHWRWPMQDTCTATTGQILIRVVSAHRVARMIRCNIPICIGPFLFSKRMVESMRHHFLFNRHGDCAC